MGSFLAAGQRVHAVDGGNSGLDEFARVGTGRRVERLAIDVAPVGRNDRRTSVARQSCAIEHAAEDVTRDGQLERFFQKAYPGALQIQFVGAFKDLDEDCIVS